MFTVEAIKHLIASNRLDIFYNDRYWRRLSNEIKQEQHNECQICAENGKKGYADVVHHVKHIRDFPELAYSRYYYDSSGNRCRQLVTLCYQCHNAEHPEKRVAFLRYIKPREGYSNDEKW
jgi:5-methylcytosine-specific restriction endonuclease McrA